MDILLISRCLPYPLQHGDRLIVYHLVRELRRRGHRFDLIAFTLDEADLLQIPNVAEMFDHIEPIQERRRSYLDYVKRLAHLFPHTAAGCWNPPMWEAVQHRLAQKRYDVIHLFGGIQVYEVRNLIHDWPNLIVPYDSYALFVERAFVNAPTAREKIWLKTVSVLAHRYERKMYQGFGRTVLVSKVDEETLLGLAPRLKTTVIPNGVDTDYFAPVNGTVRAPSLIFVGNYSYRPNLTAAIALINEILPRVRSEVPEADAVLVGPEPPVELVSLGADRVEVTGYVSDIRPYLARAGCFVAPLMLGSGIKNKILEAMAMSVPVVSTPLGCEGISVTDGKDVLLGESTIELAKAVIRLFRDDTLRSRVATGGQQLVHRLYNWRRVAAQYETLYRNVISEYHTR